MFLCFGWCTWFVRVCWGQLLVGLGVGFVRFFGVCVWAGFVLFLFCLWALVWDGCFVVGLGFCCYFVGRLVGLGLRVMVCSCYLSDLCLFVFVARMGYWCRCLLCLGASLFVVSVWVVGWGGL